MIATRIAACLGAAALGGCTTSLSVSEVTPPLQAGRPATLPSGFVYYLPAAAVTPTAFVAIRDCPVDADLARGLTSLSPAGVKPVTEVTFVVGGAIAVAQVPDQRIAVDYRNLQKFLKTTSFTMERWPNGMLKSVNASIEDQTPQAIAAIAAAAGSVALLSTGAPGAGALLAAAAVPGGKNFAPGAGGGASRTQVSFLACNARTVKLVADRKAAAASRDAASGLMDTAAAAAALLGAQPNADQAKLDKLKADVAKDSAQLDKAIGELAVIDAQLTLPLDLVSSRDGSVAPAALPDSGQVAPSRLTGGLAFTPASLDRFVAAHFVQATGKVLTARKAAFDRRPCAHDAVTGGPVPDETCSGIGALRKVLTKVARVELRDRTAVAMTDALDRRPTTASLASVRREKDGVPGANVSANRGIIYVEPARMRLEMTAADIGPESLIAPTKVVKAADVSIPQLGQYMALPLRAGFGERVELKATFAEDGTLLTGTFANPKTSGAAIADTIKQVTTAAVTSRDAVEDRRLKLVKSRAEALSAVVSAQESAGKLAPSTDPLADANSQLARANVDASIAEAELRIQTARAKLAAPVP